MYQTTNIRTYTCNNGETSQVIAVVGAFTPPQFADIQTFNSMLCLALQGFSIFRPSHHLLIRKRAGAVFILARCSVDATSKCVIKTKQLSDVALKLRQALSKIK